MKSGLFSHIYQMYNLSVNVSTKEKNLSKAEGHIKRSILDCYKYICMAYEDEYSRFDKMFEDTDLSLVDNGEFLPKLLEARNNAINLMRDAQKIDLVIASHLEVFFRVYKYRGADIGWPKPVFCTSLF